MGELENLNWVLNWNTFTWTINPLWIPIYRNNTTLSDNWQNSRWIFETRKTFLQPSHWRIKNTFAALPFRFKWISRDVALVGKMTRHSIVFIRGIWREQESNATSEWAICCAGAQKALTFSTAILMFEKPMKPWNWILYEGIYSVPYHHIISIWTKASVIFFSFNWRNHPSSSSRVLHSFTGYWTAKLAEFVKTKAPQVTVAPQPLDYLILHPRDYKQRFVLRMSFDTWRCAWRRQPRTADCI